MTKSDTVKPIRVVVIDMQPITPPLGGGRQRLLGLWHDLGRDFQVDYIGTYDWHGEKPVEISLSETLTEYTVPLSLEHFSVVDHFKAAAGQQSLVDTIFPQIVPVSAAFLERARAGIREAEVVVISHPWVYTPLSDQLDGKLVIYDSHNVELLLKMRGLARNALGYDVLRAVARLEAALVERADHVLVCSLEDKNALALIYGAELHRISLAPNGAFVEIKAPLRKSRSKTSRPSCVFLGSNFGPNIEAALFLIDEVAPRLPNIDFKLIGHVSSNSAVTSRAQRLENVQCLGLLEEEQKNAEILNADFAVNPILSGSGTNVKMFDFMAAALPIVATIHGARGIARKDVGGIRVCEPQHFADAIRDLVENHRDDLNALGLANHALAVEQFSWKKISNETGQKIRSILHDMVKSSPNNLKPAAPKQKDTTNTERASFKKVTILSTYRVRCGIAKYAEQFAQALAERETTVNFLSATTPVEAPSGGSFDFENVWEFDNVDWTTKPLNIIEILNAVKRSGIPEHFNIHYHPAFFSYDDLVELAKNVKTYCQSISIVFHNSTSLSETVVRKLQKLDVILFVHHPDEANRLKGAVHHLPFGSVRADLRTISVHERPLVIGNFGFNMEHKRVGALIQSLPIIRQVYPTATILANCAIYASEASREAARKCHELISKYNLRHCVTLNDGFQSDEEIAEGFKQMSIAVFPYAFSNEGSSAAANAAVMAGVPTLTSTSPIFTPLTDKVYQFADVSPEGIAFAVLDFMSNRPFMNRVDTLAEEYRREHAWPSVLERFLEIVNEGAR